jgi:Peptidase family M28
MYNGELTGKRKDRRQPAAPMDKSIPLRVGTLIGLAALCAFSVARVTRPPSVVPATSPDTVFSAERAMRDVESIAARPHAMGMADHDRVRDYIISRLTAMGIKPQLQTTTAVGTRFQESGRVQNILAWLPGTSSTGKALLLVVHYDGVEAGPAAADDGAGCAALLETLRALRARKQPLAHDVIALFTDGEEAGLLGAAAFVREHPWAKDVAFMMNFEARGTTGRSYMFQTGEGNRDAASALRGAGDVTAGSVFTTIYRALPNDTDLSELMALGVPALNFAFADGVLRYHTANDDVAHLDARSVQHHGAQMLAMTKKVASENLPRVKTRDGIFFDLPLVGLIVYPVAFAIPLALVALVLTVIVVRRDLKGVGAGAAAMVVAVALSGAIGWMIRLHGPAMWSGTFAAAVALGAVAINLYAYALATRWSPEAHAGALVVWLAIALATSILAPGASYLFVWPLLFALIAARSRSEVAWWISVAVTLLLLAGLAYTVAAIMLGVAGPGSAALAIVTALIVWLSAPLVMRAAGGLRRSWPLPAACAAAAVVFAIIGAATSGASANAPQPSALVFAQNADGGDAVLGSLVGTSAWAENAIGSVTASPPAWAAALHPGMRFSAKPQTRANIEGPTAKLVLDTLIDGARRVIVRVNAPPGTTALTLRATGAPVVRTAIDARVADTTRFRYHSRIWTWTYWAVPDSGAVFSIAVPPNAHFDLAMTARRPGLPASVVLPPRPADVVPLQTGDATVVYRTVRF